MPNPNIHAERHIGTVTQQTQAMVFCSNHFYIEYYVLSNDRRYLND